MKNIAILIYDYSLLGGAQKVTYYLAETMKANKFPIKCIMSFADSGDMVYNYNVNIEVIGENDKTNRAIKEIVEKYNLKNVIVQVENLKFITPYIDYLGSLGCHLLPVLHSSPKYWIKKYYSLFEYFESPRFMCQYLKMIFYWKPLNVKLFRYITERYGFICVSNNARKELCQILNIPNDNKSLDFIYNPIEKINNDTIEYKKKNNIVYVGRMSEEKRPITMLKLWKQIQDLYPDWSFILLGDGPMRRKMEKYIKTHKLERLRLMGAVDNVDDYLRQSKISILLSKYEGLPTGLLESSFRNNALVVSNSDGGAVDIVEDGVNGYVVNPLDWGLLLHKMKSLMSDDGALALELGNNNKYVLGKFSTNNIIDKWAGKMK